jgi:hypothetical protein
MAGSAIPDTLEHPHGSSSGRCLRHLQKEGVALGARDQELRQRRQAGVIAEEGLQQCVGARGRQRVEPQLRVVGLAAPAIWYSGR